MSILAPPRRKCAVIPSNWTLEFSLVMSLTHSVSNFIFYFVSPQLILPLRPLVTCTQGLGGGMCLKYLLKWVVKPYPNSQTKPKHPKTLGLFKIPSSKLRIKKKYFVKHDNISKIWNKNQLVFSFWAILKQFRNK